MAKGRQALSLWRGRAGGIVYSTLNGQQIMRSAPASVSNPKSNAQSAQRMKLAPAQHFYTALEGTVSLGFSSHTFQGRKYGNANRLRFLQLAMLNNQGPYVPKDMLSFVPFDYQISEGSLPSMTARVHVIENGTIPGDFSQAFREITFTAENVEAWADFLGVAVGDQISFLNFWSVGSENYTCEAARVKVVAGESINLADYDLFIYGKVGEVDAQDYGSALFATDDAALAVVVSRQQENGSFLRSSEWVVISDTIREKYYTPEALEAALASYGQSADVNTASPYYNNMGNAAFDGTVYLSTFKVKTVGNATTTIQAFWGKRANGNKVIFVYGNDPETNNRLIGWVDGENVALSYTTDDIVSSVQWAGQEEWLPAYADQWLNGQKAIKPYVSSAEGTEENPKLWQEIAPLAALPHSLFNYSANGKTALVAVYFNGNGIPKLQNILIDVDGDEVGVVGTFKGGLLTEVSVAPDPITPNEVTVNGIVYKYAGGTVIDDNYLGASASNSGYGPSPSIEELIVGDFKTGSPVVGTNVDLSDLAGANVFAFVSFDDDGGHTAVLLAKDNSTGLKAVFDGENVVGMTDRLETDYESLLNENLAITIGSTQYTIPADHWRIEIVADPESIVPFVKDFVA